MYLLYCHSCGLFTLLHDRSTSVGPSPLRVLWSLACPASVQSRATLYPPHDRAPGVIVCQAHSPGGGGISVRCTTISDPTGFAQVLVHSLPPNLSGTQKQHPRQFDVFSFSVLAVGGDFLSPKMVWVMCVSCTRIRPVYQLC